MAQPLTGKVALITGASSGMGRATAIALADRGANIVCADLQEKPNPRGFETDLDKTTPEVIAARGGEAIFQAVDIADVAQVEAAFTTTISTYGRLDIVVNGAGYWTTFRLFAEEDEELWAKMVAVNTLGTARMNRLAIRQFLTQEVDPVWGSRSRIVNVSSCAGVTGFPGEVAYSATKACINHMTRAGALDHAKDSVNINCVAPGVVATGMARGNLESDAIRSLMERATPWPRLGTPADIAGAIVFLCLPESQWMTGQVLSVDGGMTISVPPPA